MIRDTLVYEAKYSPMLQPFAQVLLTDLLLPPLRLLQEALMPRRCVFCGVLAKPDEAFVCTGCDADLPRIHTPCRRCAMPLPSTHVGGASCGACQVDPPPFVTVVAPFAYRFPLDAAIKSLKFKRKLFYTSAFRPMLLRAAGELPKDIDAVLPVPLHHWRRLRRGFNQADELAVPLCESLCLDQIRNVRRVVRTPYQSGLDARERLRNLRDAFKIDGGLDAKHVLIVDDVITTGATGRSLARLLRENGVTAVSMLALARAV